MPLIDESSYRARRLYRLGDFQTVWPTFFRRPAPIAWRRERVITDDSDFLDIDWLRGGHSRLAILSHGLEGSSKSQYISGMASVLAGRGWDIAAWNMRGCSGEPNRRVPSYHSGKSEDLCRIINAASEAGHYQYCVLVGFSVGGNIVLKYLGEKSPRRIPVAAACAFSVPANLAGAAVRLALMRNRPYMRWFLGHLKDKLVKKADLFPNVIDLAPLGEIRTFPEFDAAYTAPFHGFRSADEYYSRASSLEVLEEIDVPTLLVNAQDDPFLTPECSPRALARDHRYLSLEVPRWGGHCGFIGTNQYWSETRAAAFLSAAI